ncbi:MAG: hypothetical protein H6908_03530 [Hyphomicrobiales bacterium]|nr:hypothetical protein [Hyphomicrobiales bacterium]
MRITKTSLAIRAWFSNTVITAAADTPDGVMLTLECPREFVRGWIEQHFLTDVNQTFELVACPRLRSVRSLNRGGHIMNGEQLLVRSMVFEERRATMAREVARRWSLILNRQITRSVMPGRTESRALPEKPRPSRQHHRYRRLRRKRRK